jgi:hypothetical protein
MWNFGSQSMMWIGITRYVTFTYIKATCLGRWLPKHVTTLNVNKGYCCAGGEVCCICMFVDEYNGMSQLKGYAKWSAEIIFRSKYGMLAYWEIHVSTLMLIRHIYLQRQKELCEFPSFRSCGAEVPFFWDGAEFVGNGIPTFRGNVIFSFSRSKCKIPTLKDQDVTFPLTVGTHWRSLISKKTQSTKTFSISRFYVGKEDVKETEKWTKKSFIKGTFSVM